MSSRELPQHPERDERVAGGGLLHRRAFLAAAASGAAIGRIGEASAAEAPAALSAPWMVAPGASFRPYGIPSKHEEGVQRGIGKPYGDLASGTGASMTPLHRLQGTITPNGLHFERHHNGVPDIDPKQHRLLVHGMVARPLVFTVDDLLRYPMVSRLCFIECGGNSLQMTAKEPPQILSSMIHGRVACAEWTGIKLSVLLDEAGIDPRGKWILAEGADAAAMSRSIPLDKVMEEAILALYQNGERVRPEQGYPMRLVVPGWIGNLNVKWVRRIKVTETPTYTKDETSRYTELMPDGRARQFQYVQEVKSLITQPSRGLTLPGAGRYEVSGLAWSGEGRIARVEVSADGGRSWADAALQEPVLAKCFTRFRIPWEWDGAPATVQSRATDEKGNVQPTRDAWLAQYAPGQPYHYNAIQIWRIQPGGEVMNAYA